MLTQEENELLTRVGPGTPMGSMLRRYWIPACMVSEVADPDCDPLRVRLLGEDLVAFRDTTGHVGLLKERCPHRGASLAWGRNEDDGLRCLYHGWKMDVSGNITETPCEPAGSEFKNKVKQPAYPTIERGDLVWAYMGPPERMPAFRSFEWCVLPPANRSVAKASEAANWVQATEGGLDSSHIDMLHIGRSVLLREPYEGPAMDVADTPYGFHYAATRNLHTQAMLSDVQPDRLQRLDAFAGAWNPDQFKYIRLTRFVSPFFCYIPSLTSTRLTTIFVPIDDEHTWYYNVFFDAEHSVDGQDVHGRRHMAVGPDLNPDFTKKRTLANNYWQDRAAMRARRTFSGIDGNPHQDMAMLESMGPVYDRTQEHLGVADVAVIRMRLRMLESLRTFMQGGEPLGLDPAVDYGAIRSYAKVVPVETPWQDVGNAQSLSLPALAAPLG